MEDAMKGVTCCSCGVEFRISSKLHSFRRGDGKTFYCPNGHAQHFSPERSFSQEDYDILRRENDSLMRQVEMLEAQLAESREKKGWKLPAWKGKEDV